MLSRLTSKHTYVKESNHQRLLRWQQHLFVSEALPCTNRYKVSFVLYQIQAFLCILRCRNCVKCGLESPLALCIYWLGVFLDKLHNLGFLVLVLNGIQNFLEVSRYWKNGARVIFTCIFPWIFLWQIGEKLLNLYLRMVFRCLRGFTFVCDFHNVSKKKTKWWSEKAVDPTSLTSLPNCDIWIIMKDWSDLLQQKLPVSYDFLSLVSIVFQTSITSFVSAWAIWYIPLLRLVNEFTNYKKLKTLIETQFCMTSTKYWIE